MRILPISNSLSFVGKLPKKVELDFKKEAKSTEVKKDTSNDTMKNNEREVKKETGKQELTRDVQYEETWLKSKNNR